MENEDFVVEDKSLAGVPLMSSNASKIIIELFSKKGQWVRKVLVREVERIHKLRGGENGIQKAEPVVKKELTRLQNKGVVEKALPAYGIWRRSKNFPISNEVDFAPIDAPESSEISIEKTIGSGDEFVYVYFSPSSKELAQFKNSDIWPCKIGRTSTSVQDRIYEQGIKTSFSEYPVVGLIIRTSDATTLEGLIHEALEACDCDIENAPGDEWFTTSPDRIEKWYSAYLSSLEILRHVTE